MGVGFFSSNFLPDHDGNEHGADGIINADFTDLDSPKPGWPLSHTHNDIKSYMACNNVSINSWILKPNQLLWRGPYAFGWQQRDSDDESDGECPLEEINYGSDVILAFLYDIHAQDALPRGIARGYWLRGIYTFTRGYRDLFMKELGFA